MSNASRHLHMGCGEALRGRCIGVLGGAQVPDPWTAFTKPRQGKNVSSPRGQGGRRRLK